jgi:class 3 adenylate cyclase
MCAAPRRRSLSPASPARPLDILAAMIDYSRAEVADLAGVDRAYVDRLIELGIITPDADGQLTRGDIRRAQMAPTLEQAGITPEDLAAGLRDGHLSLAFLDSPAYERFATLSDETFQDLSERTGLPLNLVMLIREAAGGAVPNPDDQVREDELAVVPLIEIELAMGFRQISIERQLRVLGDGLRRVAETQSDAWRSDITEPMIANGASFTEMGDDSVSGEVVRHDRAMDEAVLAIWRARSVRSWSGNIITGLEQSLADAGLLTALPRPPAICFLDITGYTRLTHERGDEAAADLAAGLGRLVHRTATERGGRPVKWLGDGVMVYFRDPGPGVLAALEMVEGVSSAGLPPAHVGLHAGPVLFQEGDYFGQTVNVAARIAEYARPSEVLVTEEVVGAAGNIDARFTEIGPVELKGISGPVRLHAAHRPTPLADS